MKTLDLVRSLPARLRVSAPTGPTPRGPARGRSDASAPNAGAYPVDVSPSPEGPDTVKSLGNSVTVLIVDDSEDQLHLLRRHFELAGCTVVVAESAEAAIRAYPHVRLDLAVIDLLLPGMTGWELTQLLQTEQPDCPVAISSVLDPDDYPETQAALPKPVTRETVRAVLRDCVPNWISP
jgi:CheY-like chemotaxis protein